MLTKFSKLFTGFLLLLCSITVIAEQTNIEKVIGYSGIGKIKWLIPSDLDYYTAVPHWTSGPRIKCKDSARESCEISVYARDTAIPNKERVSKFFSQFKGAAKESVEKSLKVQAYGLKNKVYYSTVTDANPTTDYRYLTLGIYANGTSSVQFQYLSNDKNGEDRRRFLKMIYTSNPIESLQIFAWKINDYKVVCENRFPQFQKDNEIAWNSSIFSSSNYLQLTTNEKNSESETDKENIVKKSRESFEQILNQSEPSEQESFCKNLPITISETQKILAEMN